jgi:predicted nucleic acid-binding protein
MIAVDTNIVFPLFVRGARTNAAIRLHELDHIWMTEPFALIEFSNILATYSRSGLATREKCMEYLEIAQEFLGPNFISVSNSQALDIALEYGVTAYDARFLAAAEMTGQLLTTEDVRLRRAAPTLTQSLDQAIAKFD